MKALNLVLFLIFISANLFAQDISINDMTCEHKTNPSGVDVLNPRLSWKINSTEFNVMQTAYIIRVATDSKFSSSKMVWQTGKISSDASVLVEYKGPELKPGQQYFWQVKVWDNKGNVSRWSETAFWETGLITPSNWKAKWIEMNSDTLRYSPASHFRKEFSLTKSIAKARVYVTSHGFYELHLNGKKVGDQVLTPGWTVYGKRLQYQVYDVTNQLVKGGNAIAAALGDGWYRGTLVRNWAVYGKKPGLLLELRLTYKDGTEEAIITDEKWKFSNDGAIRMNDIYNG